MAVMHVVFAALGAVFGATAEPGSGWVFGALVGAFIGYAIAEFAVFRGRIRALQDQVAGLLANLERRADQPPAQPAAADAAVGATPAAPAVPAEITAEPARTEAPAAPAKPAAPSPLDALAEVRREELSGASAGARGTARSGASAGARPAPRPAPRGRPLMEQPAAAIRAFFTGGNALVRAGIIILFFGVAFLLRYVTEHSHVPIEFRVAGVAVGGVVLLLLGWRLRQSRAGYALALQGGGVGILYLTIFAALHLYALLPPAFAFALLAALAGLSAVLAILQNSQAFAVLAASGGFLAPILAATGDGSHVVLFSYYAVLNGAIAAMAWFRTWRPLNLVGFAFTFIIATAWGVLKYRPQDFATTEPFLILFFLFYVAVAVLFTLRQPANLRGYVDGTLVFGLPIVAFGLQSAMLHDRLFSLAFSAVAVSALYLALAWSLHRGGNESRRTLVEAFIALGVAFLTLAVPLALDSHWNAGVWALEGSALIWIGCRQERRLPRTFGTVLILAAGCVMAQSFDFSRSRPVLALGTYLGVLTLSAAALFAAWTLEAHRSRLLEYEQRSLGGILFLWGLFWWLAGGRGEISQFVAAAYVRAALLGFAAITALGLSELYRRARLSIARGAALFLLPVMIGFAAEAAVNVPHPFTQGGWVSWPAAFVILYLLLHRLEGSPAIGPAKMLHAGSAWLMAALLNWETAWAVNTWVHGGDSWSAAAWALWPLIAVFCLPRLATRVAWPFRTHREAYLSTAGAGFFVYLGIWSFTTNVALRGDGSPLPYVPLLNPLDIAQAFVFVAIIRYRKFSAWNPRTLAAVFSGLAFIWANGILLRTLHQWAGIPFSIEAFAGSTLAQTALSIFWATLALSMMLVAARRSNRPVWLAGAALLTVVVAKLFLVDLSRVGSIERIISFVGVGVLMLIVGYLSPLPPAVGQQR